LSKQVKLTAQPRAAAGKGETNRLRRSGRVPAILYGFAVEPTAVSVDDREQRHALRRDTLHVDFVAVDRNARIEVDVPIHLVDLDDVARDGGYVNHVRHAVPIQVRPLDTPDFIELSVAGMAIGDVKRLGDIIPMLPEGAEMADDADRVIVTITAPTGGGATEDAEEGDGAAAAATEGAADGDAAA
jgi:large subunit ribosomal protein L25